MASTLDSKKKLALAIIDFLNTSQKDGTLGPDDTESAEIAANCISDIFQVDPSNKTHMSQTLGQQNLLQIYTVYEKLKSGPASSSEPTSTTSQSGPSATTPESEKLKSQGNDAMKQKNYPSAIDLYTKAIALSPTNAIYLSNRAAAYSASQDYTSAASDAELAVAADPSYAKGWSRLGAARYALGDLKSSVDAYAKAMEVEGGGSDLTKKGYETAKRKLEEQEKAGGGDATAVEPEVDDAPGSTRGGGAGGMPDLSALAGMFGGQGGGGGRGGGGGMPDLGAMMNNPMFAQMAQNFMRNPEQLQGLMQNPQVRAMAESMGMGGMGGAGGGAAGQGAGAGAGAGADRGSGGGGTGGGGMPDLASMMQDPSVQEMARNLMGGGAGRGAGRGA